MALRTFLFDVSPAGTTLSNANVKSVGDLVAASPVGATVGTATVISATTDLSASGWAAEFSVNSGSAATIRTPLGSTTTTGVYSFYQEADSTPSISGGATGGLRLLNMRFTSAGITIDVRANGTVVLANGSTTATSATGVWNPAAGTRFDLSYNVSGTSTLDIFAGDSTTPIATVTVGAGTASGTCSSADLGVLSTGLTSTWVTRIAAARMDPASTTQLGPYIEANDAPVVTAGATQTVAAGATVNLSFGVSDTDGTIASRTTTYDYPASGGPTITGGTGNTPSFTAGSAGALYIVRHTATDDDGATGFALTEVRVSLAGATTMRTLAGAGSGAAWTNTGGAASDGAALADESDTTFLESPSVSGTETARRARLQPSSAKATGILKNRLWTDEGTANATVRLYEGATLRQSWSHALTTTPTEFSDTLSGGTISAITDWGNLYVEIGATS